MTIAEIKTEIGKRIGDPALTTYGDRVESYFLGALAELFLATPGVELADIPFFIESHKDTGVGTGISSVTIPSAYLKIVDVECTQNINVIPKTPAEWNRDLNNPYMQPEKYEVFYTVKDDKFYYYMGNVTGLPSAPDVSFSYIENPSGKTLGTGEIIISDNVLYTCIDMTVFKMKKEFKMEQ